MKRVFWVGLAPLLASLVLVGCSGQTEHPPEKIYDVKAKVVAIDKDARDVTLDHEAMPGFMNAMVMKFPVADAKVLEGIKEGDQVVGKLKVTSEQNMVTELKPR